MSGHYSSRYRLVTRRDFLDGRWRGAGNRIRMNPWGGVKHVLQSANDIQRSGTASILECQGAVEREIALCSFYDGLVYHDPGVAHTARQNAYLDLALFANDVPIKRKRAIGCNWRLSVLIPADVAQELVVLAAADAAKHGRCIEHQLSRANPVLHGMQVGRIENDLGLLLSQPFEISRRLTAWVIHRIASIDRPHRS